MDARFISTPSLIAAMHRSGAEYAPDPQACFQIACDVQESLDRDEFVLECANTTSPGFHSLVVVTNKRIFLGAGPGILDVLDVRNLTRWRIIEQTDMSLELQVFGRAYTMNGLGPNGISRITHALRFVLQSQADAPPTMTSTTVEMLNNSWLSMQNGAGS